MESNSFNTLFKTGIIGFTAECYAIVFDLRWMILLAFVLIIADFLFGISASKLQGIEIRKSRAGRRTLNKVIDYLCYILLGAVIGKAICTFKIFTKHMPPLPFLLFGLQFPIFPL